MDGESVFCKERRVFSCEQNSFYHADLADDPLSRDIEGRSVVHRGAQDRHAVGDGNGPVEVEGLGRDVALVVIQGQDAVVAADRRLMEDLAA